MLKKPTIITQSSNFLESRKLDNRKRVLKQEARTPNLENRILARYRIKIGALIVLAFFLMSGTRTVFAVSYDKTVTAFNTATLNITPTGSHITLVAKIQYDGGTVTAVSSSIDGAFTKVGSTLFRDDSTWVLQNASAGTHTITLTGSSGADWGVVSYKDSAITGQPEASGNCSGANGCTVTLTTAADSVMTLVCTNDNGGDSAGTNATARTGFHYANANYESTSLTAGSNSVQVLWSGGNPTYSGCQGLSLLNFSSGGGGGTASSTIDATSTIDQSQQNLFNGIIVFMTSLAFVVWSFRRRAQ